MRPRNDEPSYLLHKPSNRAYSRINGKVVYWPGAYGSQESRAAHRMYCAQLLAHGQTAAMAMRPEALAETNKNVIVASLVGQFLKYADRYYRDKTGKKTSTDKRHKHAAKTLLDLFPTFLVSQFGPKQMRLFVENMMSSGLARRTINYRLTATKQMWKWAAAEGVIPIDDYNRIRDFPSIPVGRFGLPEPKEVLAVPEKTFLATLPFIPAPFNVIAELNRLTGCRPAEILAIRPADLDTTITPWAWRIPQHKSSWRGKQKVLYLGPRCRELLTPLLEQTQPGELIFSWEGVRKERAQSRQKKAKEAGRRASRNGKTKGDEIHVWNYGAAIGQAAKAAGVEHWTPNQLRHLKATELRREYGLEAAQIALGHTRADVTQIYAERDAARLRELAERTG